MISTQEVANLAGHDVYGSNGDKIGTVGHVWGDPSGAPAWAGVKTGLFGAKESMIPLSDANMRKGRLVVPFNKAQVKDAPQIDGSNNEPLLASDFAQLHDYYDPQGAAGVQGRQTTMGGNAGYTADDVIDERSTVDDVLTRSEERLVVGTERERIGVAHLRKYVVTEEQSTTVPISHDEVRLVREPITDSNWAATHGGADLTDIDVELFAERPILNTETVPVEVVRMVTETVTEQQTVRGQVRKEHIEAALPNEEKRELD
jgi:uncharacterized protein (TIGR02271 family)